MLDKLPCTSDDNNEYFDGRVVHRRDIGEAGVQHFVVSLCLKALEALIRSMWRRYGDVALLLLGGVILAKNM